MAAHTCTHCGEETLGISVVTGKRERQHIKCWVFVNNNDYYKEMYE